MALPYSKPFLSIPQQLALLRGRGLDIGSQAGGEASLTEFGYYRLSGYWHPLRQTSVAMGPDGRLTTSGADGFRPGASLTQATTLAEFDRSLRMLFLEAIERIEVAIRVQVALLLGSRDPWAHRDPSQFYPKFSQVVVPSTGMTVHQDWLKKLDNLEAQSKEQFSVHYRNSYTGPPPLWISIEVWDFGMLSWLIGGMEVADQKALGSIYGLRRRELLPSWLRAINHIRNVCAHHSRLWNRSPSDQPVPPRVGELQILDHLASDSFALVRVYAVAAVMQFLLRQVSVPAGASWAARLKTQMAAFPVIPGVPATQSGFPVNWAQEALWT